MNRINLDHWFTNDNELSISLMNLYASITICNMDKSIYFNLRVVDSNKQEMFILYKSLEEAITFVEEVVSKCYSIDDVVKSYKEYIEQKKLKREKK